MHAGPASCVEGVVDAIGWLEETGAVPEGVLDVRGVDVIPAVVAMVVVVLVNGSVGACSGQEEAAGDTT